MLGDHQRRMIGQHDASGADADAFGRSSDMADNDRGRCACDALHAMMLGNPIAGVAKTFGMGCKVGSIGQRLAN